MSKYRNHEEFGSNAPINWREKTTSEVYLEGLSRIAPPGMKPRERRGQRFESRTDKPQSARWHHNYDLAMFGDTEIPQPAFETRQTRLESLIEQGEIARIPRVTRR